MALRCCARRLRASGGAHPLLTGRRCPARGMTTAAAGGEPGVRELSAEQFGELLSTREGLQLMDVREDWEFETARIKGFVLKPLSRFAEWCDVGCTPFVVSLAV